MRESFWILFFSSKLAIDVILVLVFVGVCWCRIFVVFFPLLVQLHTGKVQDHFAMELEHLFISLAKILKSEGGGLILQLFFGFLFFGRLVQAVDLH